MHTQVLSQLGWNQRSIYNGNSYGQIQLASESYREGKDGNKGCFLYYRRSLSQLKITGSKKKNSGQSMQGVIADLGEHNNQQTINRGIKDLNVMITT